MANKTFHSTPVTFIDRTDERKLDVYLTSNYPTVQIYDANSSTHTPDWSIVGNELKLTASVYLDSLEVTPSEIKWSYKVGTDAPTDFEEESTNTLTIGTNVLNSANPIITYICQATYQNVSARAEITFTRVQSGINGANGADGTGFVVKGTAASVTPIPETDYYTITYGAGVVATAELGDAYLYNGDLYVCADSREGQDYFINVGRIQGPQGEPGNDAKSIILHADNQVFKVSKTGAISPANIKVTAQAVNTSITNWSYSTNGGQSFLDGMPAGATVSQDNKQMTVPSESMISNTLVIKVSDGGQYSDTYTIYKVSDGLDGKDGDQGDSASLAFLTNENISFSADAYGVVSSTTFSTNVVAYNGTTKVKPTIGTISGQPSYVTVTKTEVPSSNEIILLFDMSNNPTMGSPNSTSGTITIPITSPVDTNLKLSWSKINTGATGRGIRSVVEHYAVHTSKESAPTSWSIEIPVMDETNQYLWNYEEINYTDNTTEETDPVVIGIYSGDGRGIESIENYYLAISESSGVTKNTDGWTTSIQQLTPSNKYLWNYEIITYTTGETISTDPYILGVYGDQGVPGNDGRGITRITEYYAVSNNNTTAPLLWQDTVPQTDTTNRYLWNYEKIEYTSGAPSETQKRVIGVHGSGIKTITNYYLATMSSSGVTRDTSGWTTTVQSVAPDKKYLWNYEIITYDAGNPTITNPSIIGAYGDTGTSASLVNITPSALYFKSTTGKDGEFAPDYIYLYPRFQNATYNGWQYSLDGGITWVAVTNANEVTVGTYNNVVNTLRISNTSPLYTDIITSISFRCNTLDKNIYDVVSIAKIYDVVDLQIGGRNLARFTDSEYWGQYSTAYISFSDGTRSKRIKATCSATDASTSALFGIRQNIESRLMKLQSGKEYTLSFLVRGNVTNLNYTYLMNPGSTNQHIGGIDLPTISETNFTKVVRTFTTNEAVDTSTGSYLMLCASGAKDTTKWFELEEIKLELGNVATDWTPAPEDMLEEASNLNVMLSNEVHFFEADTTGVPKASSIVLDIIGYKGSVRSNTTVGTITGIPSTGMGVTTSNNGTTNTKITINVTTNLTSAVANYGTLTIPITVDGQIVNKTFSWAKSQDLNKLVVGGRNLLYDSTFNEGSGWPQIRGTIIPAESDKPNSKIYHVVTTNTSTTDAIASPIYSPKRIYVDLKAGDSITTSYDFYTDNFDNVGTTVSVLRLSTTETGSDITSLVNHGKIHLTNMGVTAGKWHRVSFVYNASTDIQGWLIFGLYTHAAVGATANYKFREIKIEYGNKATAWTPSLEEMVSVTFQLYAPNGYLLTSDTPEVTLQTFAHEGSQEIKDATFKWYSWVNEAWVEISGATGTSLAITKSDVLKTCTYKCEMTYRGNVYTATETIEDKTDIYDSLITVNAKRSSTNNMYWILYTKVYSEDGEKDMLLGPISETAPTSPTMGSYWYQIDTSVYSVTLKKYSGTTWDTTTDGQELTYDWLLYRDVSDMVSIGNRGKVVVVKSSDFARVCSVQCGVFDSQNTLLALNNQILNDPTDPIVAETAPTNPIDGQIWIRVGDNNTYILSVWSAEKSQWIVSNADSQRKIYTSKPSQYNAGDLWIVGGDYRPIAYIAEVKQDYQHLEKTMLVANAGSQTYNDSHWVDALSYNEQLANLSKQVEPFQQFFSFDGTGMTMQAKSPTGVISEFKTKLTNTELGFYQGEDRVAYINNNQLNISKAEITNGLVVSGTIPQMQIGNFIIIQESNGSLSIG